jgi:mannose-6-phosphate isomerase class I
MPLLLKLTQAKGNSYQIHLKPGHSHPRWRPKAEAWYYFATGCLTLGVREEADWSEYEKTVREIAARMTALSREVRENGLNLEKAKNKAAKIVRDNNPSRFVNQITAREGEVYDLSACGLHHSWEEDPRLAPRGNLVYEIQEDVPDEASSIRCFDKGKIKDDGSLREIHLDDYFRFIDRSPEANDPDAARRQPKLVEKFSGGQTERLMTSPRYHLELITLSGAVSGRSTDASRGFHHLFAKTGSVAINYGRGRSCRLEPGTSVIIPAALGSYELSVSGDRKAEIIKSYV